MALGRGIINFPFNIESPIPDAGGYYATDTINGAFQEIGSKQVGAFPVALRDTTPVFNARSNDNQTGTTRFHIQHKNAFQDMVIAYSNHYSNGVLIANTNVINVKASVEINGSIIPVYFNGKRTIEIGMGAVVYSDPVGCMVVPTDVVYIRTYFDAGSGGYIAGNIELKAMVNLSGVSDGLDYGSDKTDTGTVTDTPSGSVYGPRGIFGVIYSDYRSFLISGDSIIDGTGDNAQASTGNNGFAARYFYAQGIGCTKISSPGESSVQFFANLYNRVDLIKNHTDVICNYGINDIDDGGSLATVKANLIKIWKYFKAKGLRVYHCTLVPKTTSTDTWLTLENQTVSAIEATRLGINAWLKDQAATGAISQSGGTLDGVFDTAATVEDAATGKWAVSSEALFSGTVDSAGLNYIRDAALPYAATTLDLIGQLKIISGTGAGQTRAIRHNDYNNGKDLYVLANFDVTPDATSTYEIWVTPTLDGGHPNTSQVILMSGAIAI